MITAMPKIDETAPWADWIEPEVYTSQLHQVWVEPQDEELFLVRDEEIIGRLNSHSLQELSVRVGFPTDFIQKLTPDLAALVLNERVQAARDQELNFVTEADPVHEGGFALSGITPAWRGACSHAMVAQATVDHLTTTRSEQVPGLKVDRAEALPQGLVLRLVSDRLEPVTRRKGDVLALGIQVSHRYGISLGASLFTRRLVCLNGMESDKTEFDWTRRSQGSPGDQLQWLREGLDQAVESYGDLLARAQQMAECRFSGDYRAAIRERARLLHIPRRYWDSVVQAFELEPGDTEWDLLNAFTRFATHSADAELARRLQRMAGDWVSGFDMVNARLPRPVATLVGAQLIEQIDEIGSALSDGR